VILREQPEEASQRKPAQPPWCSAATT